MTARFSQNQFSFYLFFPEFIILKMGSILQKQHRYFGQNSFKHLQETVKKVEGKE